MEIECDKFLCKGNVLSQFELEQKFKWNNEIHFYIFLKNLLRYSLRIQFSYLQWCVKYFGGELKNQAKMDKSKNVSYFFKDTEHYTLFPQKFKIFQIFHKFLRSQILNYLATSIKVFCSRYLVLFGLWQMEFLQLNFPIVIIFPSIMHKIGVLL